MTEKNERPWGRYDILDTGDSHQVKRILIKPGQRNSYQSHKHRTEHWIVVSGTCRAVIDDNERDYHPGEVITVPVGVKHRYGTADDQPCVLIEVQTGDYFGEDDIERFSDDYGRVQ